MTTYQGPDAGIANGNPFLATQVEDSFDRFAESVNAVDDTNFPTDNTLTYRSVHPGALTQTFGESQVIHQEPACWVAIGRGGAAGEKPTDYSLGSSENLYTVDGCSTRVVVSRDGVIKVNSFIEIESIKVSQEILDGATPRKIHTVDLDIEFKLKFMEAGETHASATTLHTVRRRQKVLVWDGSAVNDAAYEAAKGYRRGLSVSLGDDVTVSGADPNGSAYDIFVTVEPTIVAAKAATSGVLSDLGISSANYNGYLFLAHLRSRSRYTSARFFLE